jgi:hypothetical protein
MLFGAAERCARDVCPKLLGEGAVVRRAGAIFVAVDNDPAVDPRRAHCLCLSVRRKALPPA